MNFNNIFGGLLIVLFGIGAYQYMKPDTGVIVSQGATTSVNTEDRLAPAAPQSGDKPMSNIEL